MKKKKPRPATLEEFYEAGYTGEDLFRNEVRHWEHVEYKMTIAAGIIVAICFVITVVVAILRLLQL